MVTIPLAATSSAVWLLLAALAPSAAHAAVIDVSANDTAQDNIAKIETHEVDGEPREVRLEWRDADVLVDSRAAPEDGSETVVVERTAYVFGNGAVARVRFADPLSKRAADEGGAGIVKAPMTGKLVALAVSVGDAVEAGTFLFAVEAMKMEHAVQSAVAGTVTAVHAETGAQVDEDAVIVEVTETGEE